MSFCDSLVEVALYLTALSTAVPDKQNQHDVPKKRIIFARADPSSPQRGFLADPGIAINCDIREDSLYNDFIT